MSPLSPQVKENTLDATHGAAVSAVIEAPLPGKRGTPGVNGGGRGATSVAAGSSVALSSPGLSFSTATSCSFPLSPLGPPSRAFSDAKRQHTSKQQHAPYLPPTHGYTATDQRPEKMQAQLVGAHKGRSPVPFSDCSLK